jgi:hypothetical protein
MSRAVTSQLRVGSIEVRPLRLVRRQQSCQPVHNIQQELWVLSSGHRLVDDGGFDYRVAVAMHNSIGFGSVGRRSSLLNERERSAWRTHELCDKQAVPDGNDAGDPFRIGRHPPRELADGYSAG